MAILFLQNAGILQRITLEDFFTKHLGFVKYNGAYFFT